MKLFKTQTFGLPGAGRSIPNGTKLFGAPVIPVQVERETARLVLYDTATNWHRGWIRDRMSDNRKPFMYVYEPPRGGGTNRDESDWEAEYEWGEYE